jgi:hypothetical protein
MPPSEPSPSEPPSSVGGRAAALRDWSVRAVNLPQHADNAIHTDAGARAQGLEAALVAGVTVYAYLSHVPATGWGTDWLAGGGAHVRFRSPVIDGDQVACVVLPPDDGSTIASSASIDADADADAVVEARVHGDVRARCALFATAPNLAPRDGTALEPFTFQLDEEWIDYGLRAGEEHSLSAERQIAHPASWLAVANRFFHEQLVTGPWIHVRSIVAHHGLASSGATIEARALVVERFDSRAGRRAIADVEIRADGERVASLEHEAIIELA